MMLFRVIHENLVPTLTDIPPSDFDRGLPTFQGAPAPPPSDFMLLLERRRQRLYQSTVQTAIAQFDEYVDVLARLFNRYKPLLTSYDLQNVLPVTTGLSYITPHHTQLDERGFLYCERNYHLPEELEEILIRYYAPYIKPFLSAGVSLSMARGHNLGWPTPKGGRSREESDVLLALHAAIANGAHRRGWSLATLDAMMEGMFGKSFTIPGFRYQMKDGWFSEKFLEGTMFMRNATSRVRAINMNKSYAKAFNNAYVKPALHGVLDSPFHNQDRDLIKQRITSWKASGWYYYATDFSRYDFHMGFEHGKACLRIAARATYGDRWRPVYEDLCTEFDTDNVVYDRNGLYLTKGGSYLSSGISTTSLVGSIGSHIIMLELVRHLTGWNYQRCQQEHTRSWDAITFGDDAVFGISPAIIKPELRPFDIDRELTAVSHITGMTITREATMRFLGYHYIMDGFPDAPTGYQTWRFAQQMAFPERRKIYPYTFIGYAARMTLIPERERAEAIHLANKPFFEQFSIGEWVPFSGIRNKLESIASDPKLLNSSITEQDSVLQILTKGFTVEEALEKHIIDDELWLDLLGSATVDVSDPVLFLTSYDKTVAKELVRVLQRIASGQIEEVPNFLSIATMIYGSGYRGVGTLYF